MNERIDYKFKELVLRLLVCIARSVCQPGTPEIGSREGFSDLTEEALRCAHECEIISDHR